MTCTGAPNTQTLRLCANSIETLDARVFGGMKNLTHVELCSNALTKLPDAFQVWGEEKCCRCGRLCVCDGVQGAGGCAVVQRVVVIVSKRVSRAIMEAIVFPIALALPNDYLFE